LIVRWMLDTDTLSHHVNRSDGKVSQMLRQVGADRVCISIITAGEMRFGAVRKDASKLLARIEVALHAVDVLAIEPPADRHYAEIRSDLARKGTPIGPNDLWIAAHARATGCILVTGNTREFSRVPGLTVENWLDG
jgi:tRNA(fMet)-specific endonuclease VapC